MDGFWDNPTSITEGIGSSSTFPSGNGAPTGSFVFYLTLMPGDYAGAENEIEQADLDMVLLHWGEAGGYAQGDGDGNGQIEQADLDLVLINWGLAYTTWGSAGAMMMSSGGTLFESNRRIDVVTALDSAFERLGMAELKDAFALQDAFLAGEVSWREFLDTLGGELTAHLHN